MAVITRKHLNQYSFPGANPEAAGASEGAEGVCGRTQTAGRQEDRELSGEAPDQSLPLYTCRKEERGMQGWSPGLQSWW